MPNKNRSFESIIYTFIPKRTLIEMPVGRALALTET